MSKKYDLLYMEAHGCAGKHRFSTDTEASTSAKSLTSVYGRPMQFYKCSACYGFHVGNVPKKGDKKAKTAKRREQRKRAKERALQLNVGTTPK